MSKIPKLEIIEQPSQTGVRFRFKSEKKSEYIHGRFNTKHKKTFPSIRVKHFKGNIKLVISCVSADPPYRQHPNLLVGKQCVEGVCTKTFLKNPRIIVLNDLIIEKSKRKDVKVNLAKRRENKIDPTKGGFDHITTSYKHIDLNRLRLCFQAYYLNDDSNLWTELTEPVISDVLYHKTDITLLQILDHSSTNISMYGEKVLMHTSQIDREDIEVLMTLRNNDIHFENELSLDPPNGLVHRQSGITIKIPPYPYPDYRYKVEFEIQLRRPSDQMTSNSVKFYYYPVNQQTNASELTEKLDKETQTDPITDSNELIDVSEYLNILEEHTPDSSVKELIETGELIEINEEELYSNYRWPLPLEDDINYEL